MKPEHLWQGEWIETGELENRLAGLSNTLNKTVSKKLNIHTVFEAAHRMSLELKSQGSIYRKLKQVLVEQQRNTQEEIESSLNELGEFLARDHLERKVTRELGTLDPFLPVRIGFKETIFESWAPLGFVVHVAPLNAFTVGPLSMMEGLLSGNVNFLKSSGSESLFPQLFMEGLIQCDPTDTLKEFVIVARISSKNQEQLKLIFSLADGIAIWGGEEAVDAVKKLAPSPARLIEWGHKISLIYLTQDFLDDPTLLQEVAKECCLLEQQACSSPQCIYVEVEDQTELERFGVQFSKVLQSISSSITRVLPSSEEAAEIRLVTELCELESCLGLTQVIEAENREWRILMDSRPSLTSSPLFRTVWIKPLKRSEILNTLRPMRHYLQTVGIACQLKELSDFHEVFMKAGAVRIRLIGQMLGSYSGEAHDGVYALQRYCKRVSIQVGTEADGISSFADLMPNSEPLWTTKPPLMNKAQFQNQKIQPDHAQLFFKSGGSSGPPKLSTFTYSDYHSQMSAGAEGLYAAGLDPSSDRCMNLFFGGGLYGSFLSFFSVLEILEATQFPMSADNDFHSIAESIVRYQVNVLLGMPSYLTQLFEKEHELLKNYRGITKLFYGGEHIPQAQKQYLSSEFGIQTLQSAGYGSVDTGPLGYSCSYCENGIHHLHQRLQYLEIIDLESDKPVEGNQTGRLIFTSKVRKGQKLERYDLGDLGYWITDPCPCGRISPRFKLLGRSGDIFRIGTVFLNYQKLTQVLSDFADYKGEVQVTLSQPTSPNLSHLPPLLKEKLSILISNEPPSRVERDISQILLENYSDLQEAVVKDQVLEMEISRVPSDRFKRAKSSGKLIRILDQRSPSQ